MGVIRVGGYEFDLTVAVGPAGATSPVQECTTFGSVTMTFDRKLGGDIAMVVRGNSPEAGHIAELASDLWILGDFPARFRVWSVWQDWHPNGYSNVSMQGVTYKRLLNRRLVNDPAGLTFNNVDQGTIVWNLWQHTQSQPGGDLGVTLGIPNTTGVTRIRNYEQGENLGQRAEDLEMVQNGLWWDITHDLQYVAFMPDSIPFVGAPIELGATAREMGRAGSGADFANVIYGDADEDGTTPVIVSDPGVGTDPRGRWESAHGWPTVKQQATLIENAEGQLRESVSPQTHWNIMMESSRWISDTPIRIGDFAVLVYPEDYASPIGVPDDMVSVQIDQLIVQFDADGDLNVSAVAVERPDIPVPIA